jgi:hypothetical protein
MESTTVRRGCAVAAVRRGHEVVVARCESRGWCAADGGTRLALAADPADDDTELQWLPPPPPPPRHRWRWGVGCGLRRRPWVAVVDGGSSGVAGDVKWICFCGGGLDGRDAGVAAVGVWVDRGLFLRRRPRRRPRDRRRRCEGRKVEAASRGAVVARPSVRKSREGTSRFQALAS